MRRALIGLTAVAVTAASAAVALGAIPGSNGTISACYDKALGYVRVYDAEDGTKACTRLERPLTWNQTGPQGPAGPQGEQALQGPQGEQGPQGPEGPAGTFSGTLESPSGQYSLSVTDTGIELAGPGGSVEIDGGGISIGGSAPVSINGALIRLNGCGNSIARRGDPITGTEAGGTVAGSIVGGSLTVCTG